MFDDFAEEHEDAFVAGAAGLGHVVRDDHDGVAALELEHEFLDVARTFDVERGARLVHEDNVGLEGEKARDAEFLPFQRNIVRLARRRAGLLSATEDCRL